MEKRWNVVTMLPSIRTKTRGRFKNILQTLAFFVAGGLDISTRWFDDGLIMVKVGKI